MNNGFQYLASLRRVNCLDDNYLPLPLTFLKIDVTLAVLHSCGIFPVSSNFLKIYNNELHRFSQHSLKCRDLYHQSYQLCRHLKKSVFYK